MKIIASSDVHSIQLYLPYSIMLWNSSMCITTTVLRDNITPVLIDDLEQDRLYLRTDTVIVTILFDFNAVWREKNKPGDKKTLYLTQQYLLNTCRCWKNLTAVCDAEQQLHLLLWWLPDVSVRWVICCTVRDERTVLFVRPPLVLLPSIVLILPCVIPFVPFIAVDVSLSVP